MVAQGQVGRVTLVDPCLLPGDVKNTVTGPFADPTWVRLSGTPHSEKNWPRVKPIDLLGDSMWMMPSFAWAWSQ